MDTTLQIIVDFVGAVIGGFIGVKLFYDNALQELTAITPRFMMEQLEEI